MLCGHACEQGSGSTPAGSDSEPEPPASSHPDLLRQSRGGRRFARHHRLPCAKRAGAHTVGQVASHGACSAAARVSKARVRRQPARIPNPSLQPRHPDLATITRRPTLRPQPWAALRRKRRRMRSEAGGVARCMLCGRACEQGSGLTPAGSDSEPEPPAPSP
eukprot:scaffold32515_cov65-Phaeocystis_antarctica.AAC.3